MVTSSELLRFLLEHGQVSLAGWCRAAGVPTAVVYQARVGRAIAAKYVEALARAADVTPSRVRAVLAGEAAPPPSPPPLPTIDEIFPAPLPKLGRIAPGIHAPIKARRA